MAEEKSIDTGELEARLGVTSSLHDLFALLREHKIHIGVWPNPICSTQYSGEIIAALSDGVVVHVAEDIHSRWFDYRIQSYSSSTTFTFSLPKPENKSP